MKELDDRLGESRHPDDDDDLVVMAGIKHFRASGPVFDEFFLCAQCLTSIFG